MKTKTTPIRMKLTAHMCDNISYLTVNGRVVSYCGASLTPFSLSNIAGNNAAALRFALEDAVTPAQALSAAKRFCIYAKNVELI